MVGNCFIPLQNGPKDKMNYQKYTLRNYDKVHANMSFTLVNNPKL